jgi:hypothetical protein
MYKKDMLSIAIYDSLYGNQKDGIESLVEILAEYKLAKWSLATLIPYYLNRDKEYFVKPTTTKNILKYFGVTSFQYKQRPKYKFYKNYKDFLNELKENTNDKSLTKENAIFTGFMMLALRLDESSQ